MDFVIIGGDAAGMSAASKAKRTDPRMRVTVLEKTEDVSYSACGMPYNIGDAKRDMDDLVVRSADVFRQKQGIHLLTGHSVTAIDTKKQVVTGTRGEDPGEGGGGFEISYDRLLVATGATPVLPDFPGNDLPGVMVLKNLAHGRQIKTYIKTHSVRHAVIVGMGYIALEMSEALRELGIAVAMLKPGPVLLPWMAPDLAQVVQAEVESKGVELLLGHGVEKIQTDETGFLEVISKTLTRKADMVLVATGVVPNSAIARDAGMELGAGNAIAVDASLKTSHDHVYAAGDCADAFHVVTGKRTYIPLALRANRSGWAVADNVCGKNTQLPGVAGTAVFKVFDLEVARTGLGLKEARQAGFDPAETVIQSQSRAHAHPGSQTIWVQMVGDKSTGRLLGVQMVGKEGVAHRINAPSTALFCKMTVEDFYQCDLAYAPPFSPVWDPMLTAAGQWLKNT